MSTAYVACPGACTGSQISSHLVQDTRETHLYKVLEIHRLFEVDCLLPVDGDAVLHLPRARHRTLGSETEPLVVPAPAAGAGGVVQLFSSIQVHEHREAIQAAQRIARADGGWCRMSQRTRNLRGGGGDLPLLSSSVRKSTSERSATAAVMDPVVIAFNVKRQRTPASRLCGRWSETPGSFQVTEFSPVDRVGGVFSLDEKQLPKKGYRHRDIR